ncbi:MAG: hypothetical protein DCC58_06840 [Chloroflexi bacterium]|nr:MAG: hypothetical protein DCC58_06840 [Chloroflexota bacterium]
MFSSAMVVAIAVLVTLMRPVGPSAADADEGGASSVLTVPQVAPATATWESFGPPGSSVPWIDDSVAFPGRTLQYSAVTWFRQPGVDDPAHGEPVYAEVWVEFDAQGQVVRSHVLITLADGTFIQESTRAGYEGTIVFPATDSATTEAGRYCVREMTFPDLEKPSSVLPPFLVAPDALAALGFAQVAAEPGAFPATSPPPGLEPLAVLTNDIAMVTWERRITQGSEETIYRFTTDPDMRVLRDDVVTIDVSTGEIIRERHMVEGPVNVYLPEAVPAAVFAVQTEAEVVCGG